MQGPRPRHELPHFRITPIPSPPAPSKPSPTWSAHVAPVHRLGLRDRALWIGRPAGEPVSLVHRGRQRCAEIRVRVRGRHRRRGAGVGRGRTQSAHARLPVLALRALADLLRRRLRLPGAGGLGPAQDMPDAQAAILDDGWPEDVLPDITENGAVIGGYLFRCCTAARIARTPTRRSGRLARRLADHAGVGTSTPSSTAISAATARASRR